MKEKESLRNINPRFWTGPIKATCPICRKKPAYIIFPQLAELSGINYLENVKIATEKGIKPFLGCLKCFGNVFAGEK